MASGGGGCVGWGRLREDPLVLALAPALAGETAEAEREAAPGGPPR